MAKLGFLGLGLMGYPMARNLLRAGHEVALWSNTAAKARELAAAEKGIFCETPKEVGAAADCIFLCVGDTEMAEEVILGENGSRRRREVRAQWSPMPARSRPTRAGRSASALAKKGIRFLGRALHRIDPGRGGRHPDLHDRRRPGGLREDRSPTSSRWARSSTTAAARAWGCRPS